MPKKYLKVSSVKVALIKEREIRYWEDEKMGPKLLAKLGRKYIGNPDREHFVLMCLDANYKVRVINTVSIGELNAALVHPREIIKVAVLSNSYAIALIHNHPGGSPQPSPEDKDLTDRIKECMELMGIQFLDHIILGDQCFYSFAASEVMKVTENKSLLKGSERPCSHCGKTIAIENKNNYLVKFGRLQLTTNSAEIKCPRCGKHNLLPDLGITKSLNKYA